MRFEYRAAGPIAAVCILLLVTACSRTQEDWRVAQQAGTARAYEIFVARHPDSELAGIGRDRAARLTEQAAWQETTRADTPAAYQAYLAKYPNGSWSQDARIRMESKSLATRQPQDSVSTQPRAAATAANSVPAPIASAMTANPAPAPTAPAGSATAPNASVGAAVQLGAFSTAANARGAWGQLSSRFGPEFRGMTPWIVPVMSSGRRLYRLEVRVADTVAGSRLCQQLQQHSQGCLPVP
jgi:cell division septation protein DedD